jgi:sugar/nucleoside kinase (ribokinase family)
VADVFANPVERLPNPGELTTTSGLVMSVGGSAANTAVALRILGQEVNVAGRVGSDIQGDFVISELRQRGIGVSHIRRSGNCSTAGTVILSVTGEDRRYLHCIGANADFGLEDLDFSFLDGVRVLCFGGYLALPLFSPAHLAKLFAEAKSRGLTTVLDVTMPAGLAYGIEDVAPALRYADYFLPNTEEAARLTGEADIQNQSRRLSEVNPECAVVITNGLRGSLARWHGRLIETPPFPMKSLDESGAGDAFTAGLVTAVLKKWDLERGLMFAAAVGASRTRALGCFNGIFTFEETVSFLEAETMTSLPGGTLF